METRIKRIFLAAMVSTSLLSSLPLSANDKRPLIEPDVVPQKVDEALIDTENFEIGAFAGSINIEDFETSFLYGLRVAYHMSERLFVEANVGFAEAGDTSFERLSGGARLLSDAERDYQFYNLNFGYNILPGEVFFKGLFSDQTYAFNTNFYLVGGAGATDFAGDNRFTANFGAGFQVLLNDAWAVHINARQHLYDIDVLGEAKTSLNTELSAGLSVFF